MSSSLGGTSGLDWIFSLSFNSPMIWSHRWMQRCLSQPQAFTLWFHDYLLSVKINSCCDQNELLVLMDKKRQTSFTRLLYSVSSIFHFYPLTQRMNTNIQPVIKAPPLLWHVFDHETWGWWLSFCGADCSIMYNRHWFMHIEKSGWIRATH